MIIRNYYTITFIILFTLFTNSSYSQQNEDLIGDWKITKVELKPSAGEEEKPMLVMLSQIFSKSTFHFKNNNLFSFDSPDKDLAIKEANWKFDSIKKYIKVMCHQVSMRNYITKILNLNHVKNIFQIITGLQDQEQLKDNLDLYIADFIMQK